MGPASKRLLIGVAAGFVGGLFGVGGGIVVVPALVLWLGYEQKQALATSLVAIAAAAGAAMVRFGADNSIDEGAALVLFAGAGLGAIVGARLVTRIPQVWLARAFVVLMMVSAARLAFTS